ncbi:MAG: hypoxanthine phosphoribosyltransferase [Clostridiales bacterium]|nr:hypoxanthine phosphoribosyltransferase [Clostridiales bacterium]
MAQNISEVLYDEDVIAARVAELGERISRDYADSKEGIILLCVLKGACIFFSDLARAITVHFQMDFLGISSYGDGTRSSGQVKFTKDLDCNIDGRHVIIAEDIMDSGLTLSHLTRVLSARNPASIRICCLLDKPERRECEITPDYCGFVVPNKFVVGYGLDYAGEYRNLPYVGVLKPEVYMDALAQSFSHK